MVVLAIVAGTVAFLVVGTSHRARPGTASPRPCGTLTERWSFETGGNVFSSPAFVDGQVVVGSDDKKVRAFDATDGSVGWTHPTDGKVRSSPLIDGDRVDVGSDDRYLYALDATTGAEKWKAYARSESVSRPARAGTVVLYTGARLDAFAVDTGDLLWNFQPKGNIVSSPIVSGDVVVFGSDDHNVYGVSLTTHEEVWHFRTVDAVQSTVVIAGKNAIIGAATATCTPSTSPPVTSLGRSISVRR